MYPKSDRVKDACYVLSCLGQFRLDMRSTEQYEEFFRVLVYGLFRPVAGDDGGERSRKARTLLTVQLKSMAFQLRMFRRRGVVPAFLSIGIFIFIAYPVSIALAFAELGEWTTAHSLALGILFGWLPMLVLVCIIDRNPVSGDRAKILLRRWLWNANAIRSWEEDQPHPAPGQPPIWWSWQPHPPMDPTGERICEFVGQGRRIGYSGLTNAVVMEYRRKRVELLRAQFQGQGIDLWQDMGSGVRMRLNFPPKRWHFIRSIAMVVVWLHVFMAFIISYRTPTVGVGCRTGFYLLYGILSSITWIVEALPIGHYPTPRIKLCCYVANTAACLVLGFAVFAQVRIEASTYCRVPLMAPVFLVSRGMYRIVNAHHN